LHAYINIHKHTHTKKKHTHTFINAYRPEYKDISEIFVYSRDHVVVRFINNDDIQSEAILRQLPEYVDTLLGIQQVC